MIHEILLEHWLFQFGVVATIVVIPTVLILRRFIEDRYTLFITKAKQTKEATDELHTITGKLGFLLKNPDMAFEKLHRDDKECNDMIKQFKDNPQMVKVWENKKNSIKWQLDMATKVMQNRQWIDFIGVDTIIPMISGVEKKIKGMVGQFTKGFGI